MECSNRGINKNTKEISIIQAAVGGRIYAQLHAGFLFIAHQELSEAMDAVSSILQMLLSDIRTIDEGAVTLVRVDSHIALTGY